MPAPHSRVPPSPSQLGSELTYSQRVLRAMRVCCCVDICCPGMADPKRDAAADARWREDQQSRKQQSGARSNGMQAPGQQAMAVPAAGQAAAAQGGQAGMFVGPNTQGLSEIGFADEAQVIQVRGRCRQGGGRNAQAGGGGVWAAPRLV